MILLVMGRAPALNGLNKQCDQDFQGHFTSSGDKKLPKK
jgi:hypothetical protein